MDITIPDQVITAIELLGGSAIGNAIVYYRLHKTQIDKLAADAQILAADIAALKDSKAAPLTK